MARIRTIKPEFWTDEKMGTLPRESRILFIGMWTFSDDIGVLKGSPLLLKSQIFPYDEDLKLSEFVKWLNTLIDKKVVLPFSYNDEQFLFISAFYKHQKIDKPSKPIIDLETLSKILSESSPNTRLPLPAVIVNSNSNSSKEVVIGEVGEKGKPSTSVFAPPNLNTLKKFFEEKKIEGWGAEKCEVQAKKFIDHYESNGWMVGKNKMASWKSAASGWISRDKEFNQSRNSHDNEQPRKSRIKSIADAGKAARDRALQNIEGNSSSAD